MTEEELKAIEKLKGYLDYNKKHKNILLDADEVIEVQETVLNLIEKQQTEINELKKDYHSLIDRIELSIDKFDYAFEKAKRRNDKDKADYYWDLIGNFKKLLEE